MTTLYKISEKYRQSFQEMEELQFDEECIKNSLVEIKDEFDKKIINTAAYIKNLEIECLQMKKYENDMHIRRKQTEKKIEWFKDYIKMNMNGLDIKKIRSIEFDVTLRKASPSTVIEDEIMIPEEFFYTKIIKRPDKDKIKKAILEEGKKIDGVSIKYKSSLIIKTHHKEKLNVKDGETIRFIHDPSEEVQLARVKQNGWAIKYINKPSEEVQLAAVNQNGWAIQHIANPSEEVQLAAVKQDALAILYINKPSRAVKLADKQRRN